VTAITALALLALKANGGVRSLQPGLRVIADSIRNVVDMHGIEEIAFVGARPFYGSRCTSTSASRA